MSVSIRFTPQYYGELDTLERKATDVSARLSEAVEVVGKAGLDWEPWAF